MKCKILALLLVILSLSESCNRQSRKQFDILKSAQTGITFNPLAKKPNQDDNEIKEFGNSVAIADLNNDGLPDLVFSGMYANPEIYINEGNYKFKNVTATSGIQPALGYNVYGVAIVDINNDGWNDIYICVNGPDEQTNPGGAFHNLLYINNKDGTFTERSADYNLNLSGPYSMAYFFDFDKDGDLDLLLLAAPNLTYNPLDISYMAKAKTDSTSVHSILLENRNGKFIDVTAERGLEKFPVVSNSCIIADLNNDGWPDIYFANDYVYPDQIYINHQGHFKNELPAYASKVPLFSMGTDCADVNNDLFPDILTGDMLSPGHYRRKMNTLALSTSFYDALVQKSYPQYQRNMLQLNNQGQNFSEAGYLYNVSSTEWTWSPLLADFDNDGYKDAFFSCGSRKELTNLDKISNYTDASGVFDPVKQWLVDWHTFPTYPYHNFIFQNQQGNAMADVTGDWGLQHTTNSEGAAYADLNNTGNLDIVACNTNCAPYILRNNNNLLHPEKRYLRIALHANNSSNYPLGTKAYVYTAKGPQYEEAINQKGYLAQSESVLHFGLDTCSKVDSLKVIWPSGKWQVLFNVKSNQVLNLYEKDAHETMAPVNGPSCNFIHDVTGKNDCFIHHEDDFNDFKRDKIIPHMVSRSGPCVAVADLNRDGLDDYYVSGAKEQAGALFMQQPNGEFKQTAVAFTSHPNKDDETAVVFADVSGDSLPDFITGIGSNAEWPTDTFQHLAIWINKGGLKFEKAGENVLPVIKYPVGTISAADYDGDGDIDLFIGCRIVPGLYGVAPTSYLLENRGGRFYDVTEEKAPGLRKLGMITSSVFADIDGDGEKELIVAGEFIPVSIFKRIKNKWEDITVSCGLGNTNGLWNCLKIVDINNDGSPDILAGNWGDNSIWRATPDEPLSLWLNDFDHNGGLDPILFHYLDHVNAPFVNRDLFCRQMPYYQNKFNNYESYARCAADDIFDPKVKQASTFLYAYTLHTSLFINDGKGHFKLKELPYYFQMAPVNSFIVYDFDNNGTQDILPLGNTNSNFYDQGDIDALRGKIFYGDGNGNFKPGILVDEMNKNYIVNSAALIRNIKFKNDMIITGVNNDTSRVYLISKP